MTDFKTLCAVYSAQTDTPAYVGGHSLFNAARNCAVVSSEWLNYRRGWSEPDIKTETTYDKCVYSEFSPSTSELAITLWDGDMSYGRPTDKRCRFVVRVADTDIEVIELLSEAVAFEMRELAEREWQRREDERKQREVDDILREFYNGKC